MHYTPMYFKIIGFVWQYVFLLMKGLGIDPQAYFILLKKMYLCTCFLQTELSRRGLTHLLPVANHYLKAIENTWKCSILCIQWEFTVYMFVHHSTCLLLKLIILKKCDFYEICNVASGVYFSDLQERSMYLNSISIPVVAHLL